MATPSHRIASGGGQSLFGSYGSIARRPYTWSIGSMGLLNYAILVAVQTLWAGPWLTNHGGLDSGDAAARLLYINTIMLVVFMVMGYLSPRFNTSADDAERILLRWTPVSIGLLIVIAYLGPDASWHLFALYCVAAWPLSVTHPLVGQRFPPNEAGRAIAFFNLLLFAGVFFWQWSFGLIVSNLTGEVGLAGAYQIALGVLATLSVLGYAVFTSTFRRSSALQYAREG